MKGRIIMKMDRVKIVLNMIDDIKNFVYEASQVSFSNQIDLVSGRYRVSATSLMGVLSLDTSEPVTMEFPKMFKKIIMNRFSKWIIEE